MVGPAAVILTGMDAEIAEQIARRDRFRRQRWMSLTPAQRVAEMIQLQERGWALLQANPIAYQRWFRHNVSARAVDRPGGAGNAA